MTGFPAAFSRGLRSTRLAVALLLALAVLAAVGTFLSPPGAGTVPEPDGAARPLSRIIGLEQTFRSPLFLSLLALAALNVVACAWYRLSLRWAQEGGRLRTFTDILLHGSLLLILTGGMLKGLLGFIGTQNVYVGEMTETVYDWRAGREARLGFEIRVDELREGYYPIQARIGVRRAATGEKLELLEVVEGKRTGNPGGDLGMQITGYDPVAGEIRFVVVSGGAEQQIPLKTKAGDAAAARAGDYDLSLVAFRADLKEVRAKISLLDAGTAVSVGWLAPNSRIRHRGLNLFLTAWGADPGGKRFCGIQVTRDRGAPLFWVGCVLLALAIPAHLYLKSRQRATRSMIS